MKKVRMNEHEILPTPKHQFDIPKLLDKLILDRNLSLEHIPLDTLVVIRDEIEAFMKDNPDILKQGEITHQGIKFKQAPEINTDFVENHGDRLRGFLQRVNTKIQELEERK